ncbi:MAG: hypothetical protein P8P30_08645 [Rickettsiales bacterium]|nr:hypothetical protein [Rickettsiales bacterium]
MLARRGELSQSTKAAKFKTGSYASPEKRAKAQQGTALAQYNNFAACIDQSKYGFHKLYTAWADKKLATLLAACEAPPEIKKADAPASTPKQPELRNSGLFAQPIANSLNL